MLLNPYIAGNPLKDRSAFFGRDDVVREVTQMLNHPDEKAIVLYGQRRIGKTTILLQIDQKLIEEGKFTPVYFDLQDRASSALPDILYRLAQTISHRVKRPLPLYEKFDPEGQYFIKDFLPETVKFSAPGGLVVLFDEFDVLDSPQYNQPGQSFFHYLRSFITDLNHVKFVFVIGRRPEELSIKTMAAFKGIRATRVSLLSRDATESVIRQSEKKKSLFWSIESVDQIWKWTQGHAFFTQLLCSVIWEHLQEKAKNAETSIVTSNDVDISVQEALKHGANAFHWIWDGLPPAERVVLAAMGEAKGDVISQDEIEVILSQSGVRLIVQELKIAPMTLIDWELLRPVDSNYRFAVPLLQQWVKSNRPLVRVKEELDRLDPLAENLFQSGQSFYNLGNTDSAEQQLRQALNINPNHLKSRLLLGRVLFELRTPESLGDAMQVLEEGYKYDSAAVAADLIKTILAYAETTDSDDKKIYYYDRILEMQPNQVIAQSRRNSLWGAKGDDALQRGDYTTALKAFTEAEDRIKVALVRDAEQQKWRDMGEIALKENNLNKALEFFHLVGDESRIKYVNELNENKWIDDQIGIALRAERREDWEHAVQIYFSLNEQYPGHNNVSELLEKAKRQSQIAQLYKQAVNYQNAKQSESAKRVFVEIIQLQPDYKDAARRLYQIIEGLPPSPSSQPTGTLQSAPIYMGKIILIGGMSLFVASGVYFSTLLIGSALASLFNNDKFGPIYDASNWIGIVLSIVISSSIALIVGVSLFSKNKNK